MPEQENKDETRLSSETLELLREDGGAFPPRTEGKNHH